MGHKIVYRKSCYPPIMHKVFRYPKFSETLKGSLQNFLARWDKKNWQNRDTPFVQKVLKPEQFWNTSVPLRNFSVLWDQTILPQNRNTPSPSSYPYLFSSPGTFWNTEGFPYEAFRSCETKKNRQSSYAFQISHAPPPSYAWKIPTAEFFWHTKGFSY